MEKDLADVCNYLKAVVHPRISGGNDSAKQGRSGLTVAGAGKSLTALLSHLGGNVNIQKKLA